VEALSQPGLDLVGGTNRASDHDPVRVVDGAAHPERDRAVDLASASPS
jgi:hypothetical protein